MDDERVEAMRKRKKTVMEGTEAKAGQGEVVEEETETNFAGSEEVEMNISRILQTIDRFTEQVSELLETGKTLFRDLSGEFEERMFRIHREHVEKWEEEIKELRALDASNEEASARLHNAQYLLQNAHINS
ncbi:knotted 1-binding protein [Tasmannia lanceolata]|uniref:knotted 1-binding protein n=1 Tax=Tasmannia lanceolata TaxID=3420 RepID=UPI004062CD7D